MYIKTVFINSSFSFGLTIQGSEGRQGFQGLPGSIGPKGQKVVCKNLNFCIIILFLLSLLII